MFIEVVHINGRYPPEAGEHITPSKMEDGYYTRLSHTLGGAAQKGVAILYRPNLTSFSKDVWGTPGEIDRALQNDPFLAVAGDIDGLVICPDGNRPLEAVKERKRLEDQLVGEYGSAVFVGAYLKECVHASAFNLQARLPSSAVYIDSALSIDRGAPYILPDYAGIPHLNLAYYD